MQQKRILFSIVIPTYNREKFILETIRSVQNQSYSNWECIIVDDGSTDNTKQIVLNLATKDNRIHYIFQKNAERSAARNNGIKQSKGDFVCFLDSDDLYEPSYLDELSHFISAAKIYNGLIISNFNNWDGHKKEPIDTPSLKEPYGDWLFVYPVSPSRACVSKSVLKKYTFREDITIVEDSVLWVSIANEYPVYHLEKNLINYRVHYENSVNPSAGSCFKRYVGLKLFFKDSRSSIVSKKVKRQMLSETKFRMAEYYLLNDRKKMASWTAIQAIFCDPFHYQTKMRIYFFKNILKSHNSKSQLNTSVS